MATRPIARSASGRIQLWLHGPSSLNQPGQCIAMPLVAVHQVHMSSAKSVRGTLLGVIKTTPSWYILKKRAAYLMAFTKYIKQKGGQTTNSKANN